MSDPACVMVIGANAFQGQDLIDLLLTQTASRILATSRRPQRSAVFTRYLGRPEAARVTYRALDHNSQLDALLAWMDQERPAWVINFAAQSEVAPSWDHPEHWFATNTVALARLINHLSRVDYLERYLHVSSPEVYGSCVGTVREDAPLNPSTPYAASKAAADLLLEVYRKQFQLPLLTVRATNVYGARQQLFKIIPRSAIYLRRGEPLELHGGGRAVKSYLHVRDVSHGELAILRHGRLGERYHLSPDQGVAVRDVVARMCTLRGRDFQASTRSVDERPGQDAAYVIDSAKARTELGWSPTVTLDAGLAEVCDWVDAHWEAILHEPLTYQHVA